MSKIILTFFLFLFLTSQGFAANLAYERAMQLKQEKKYHQAEEIFLKLATENPNNTEFWFELGLVLRYQEQFDAALLAQKNALKADPQNADAKLEIARMESWKSNYAAAENLTNEVLLSHPNYSEAQELLAKIKQAQKKYLWQLSLGYQHSELSRVPQDDWKSQYAEVGRWISNQTLLRFYLESFRRYQTNDQYYEAGINHIFSKNYDGSFAVGYVDDPSFLSKLKITASGEARVIRDSKTFGDTWLTLNVQQLAYNDTDVTVIKPGARYFITKNLELSAQYIIVSNQSNNYLQEGWSWRGDWQTPLPSLRIFLGLAKTPETQDGITVDTKSRFGGVAYDITPRVTLRLSYGRDDRENSFIRKIFDTSLSVKF